MQAVKQFASLNSLQRFRKRSSMTETSKDNKSAVKNKKQKKPKHNPGYIRHRILYEIIKPFATLFLKLRFGFKRGKMVDLKGPFVLVCNHVTNFDMIFTSCVFKEYIYYVASEHTFRAGFASWLLRWVFDPIGRTKVAAGGSTVMEMK